MKSSDLTGIKRSPQLNALLAFVLLGTAPSLIFSTSLLAFENQEPLQIPLVTSDENADVSLPDPDEAPVIDISLKDTEKSIELSIREALSMALQSNLDVAISRISPAISKARLAEAEAELDPRFTANVDYGETSSPRTAEQIAADGRSATKSRTANGSASVRQKIATGAEVAITTRTRDRMTTFNDFSNEFNSFTGVEVTQPLLKDFGSSNTLADIRIARKSVEIAHQEFIDRVEQIVQNVYFTYFDLLLAQQDLDSKVDSLGLAQKLLEDNKSRQQLGAMTMLDVSKARAEVASRLSLVVEAENTLSETENSMVRLISRDVAKWLSKSIATKDKLYLPGPDRQVKYDIAVGLENRADFIALLKEAQQRNLQLSFRKNQLLPQLDLQSSFGYSGLADDLGKSFKNVTETRDEQWTVGLRFSIPWGNKAEISRVEQAKLEKARTLLSIKDKEQAIIIEIDNAVNSVHSARKKYEASLKAREFEDQNAFAEEAKLKEGASTTFVVLEIQRNALLAKIRELRDLADYNKALIRLKSSQGILLKDSGILLEQS
ncbi:MAG: TolC family protein [Verrucomicrobiota bacterium]